MHDSKEQLGRIFYSKSNCQFVTCEFLTEIEYWYRAISALEYRLSEYR